MPTYDQLPFLARNVIRCRRHHRLTQGDLAARCKMSRKTISNVERGEVPSFETILALAQGLGTTPAKLLDDPSHHRTLTRYLNKLRLVLAQATRHSLRDAVRLAKVLLQRPRPAT